jgi:hypothetical protein
MKTIEATVVSIESYKNFVLIEYDALYDDDYLMLKKSNPNFINLYNVLHIGKTYLFEYKQPKIISLRDEGIIVDIRDPSIRFIINKIEGFLNITNEYPKIKTHPFEIKFCGKQKNKRLLVTITQQNQMKINGLYKIKFQKAFGSNLFEVIEFEQMCDYSDDEMLDCSNWILV